MTSEEGSSDRHEKTTSASAATSSSSAQEPVTFDFVCHEEFKKIKGDDPWTSPSVAHELTGLALSGGGIRSASFGLGVLQALNAEGALRKFDYLSTVSGGGYIGTSMTVAMSAAEIAASENLSRQDGEEIPWRFPFGKTGEDVGETDETRHLRDRSRYLLQNGSSSALSAFVVYCRGITMNIVVILPILLFCAALLAFFKPDTRALSEPFRWLAFLPPGVRESGWPLSICSAGIFSTFLLIYAILASVTPIPKKPVRERIATAATVFLMICFIPFALESHFAFLKVLFPPASLGIATSDAATNVKGVSNWFSDISNVVAVLTPLVLATMPFLRQISKNAITAATGSLANTASKWTSRLLLIVVAAVAPLLLWISILQLAYWAIGITSCGRLGPYGCAGAWGGDTWDHTPPFLSGLFEIANRYVPGYGASATYGLLAGIQLVFWLVLNVNSNSLHQLYRDRLGGAFLFANNGTETLEDADKFKLSQIVIKASPYHLINVALNVPGSRFANRRGRNADFFLFSKLFVGSELTGYIDTELAESAMDGLNIGTAMAISGAAAAPNMGMASMRPLSPTIALLNVRLGRWMRHPRDIIKYASSGKLVKAWRGRPGPLYLLSEAFFKSGKDIGEQKKRNSGFVFLTDGGHIENLGVYELLRRRCSLIVAVDAEADPDYTFSSLVQLERFARIDLGTRIVLDWKTIANCSRSGSISSQAGPHVAIGRIDYPASTLQGPREEGVFVYIKSSLSGDENDYVADYKRRNPAFPQESTMEQLFSEEQFEAYRALGEHIGRRFCRGEDAAILVPQGQSLVPKAKKVFPNLQVV